MSALMRAVDALGPRADRRFRAAMEQRGAALVVKWGIDDPVSLSEVFGQMAHETGGFRKFEENMNYSARRITQVWPGRFPTLAAAAPYANNPEKLANRTYANRMGNGPPESGDGWRFRGGGGVHHTGRAEYDRVKRRTGYTADQVRDPGNVEAIFAGAVTYLQDRRLMDDVKAGRTDAVSRGINGGTIGLDDRRTLTRRAREALAGERVVAQRTTLENRDAKTRAATGAATGGVVAAPAADAGAKAGGMEGAGLWFALGVGAVALVAAGLLGWSAWRDAKRVRADEDQTREARLAAAEAEGATEPETKTPAAPANPEA